MKKDLTNTKALCTHLGEPQTKFPSIHIAGTNGKGSTAHILCAIFQVAGLKTGLYTSPHYRDFRERIKINGKLVSKQFVNDFVENHGAFFEKLHPSFFEITVAMAFEYFAKEKVELAIVETGLGGRLDSTNVITPLISVITNIGYDHQQFLGDTLESIAGEKAGIIKPGIPVVIGEEQPQCREVFNKVAKEKASPVYFADRVYKAELQSRSQTHDMYLIKKNGEVFLENLSVNVKGAFQQKNLQTVFQTIEVFNALNTAIKIEESHIREALHNLKTLTNFQGRWQQIGDKPTIICDSAHNEDGLKIAMQELQYYPHDQLHVVLGMVNDKTIDKMLNLLPKKAIYYFAKADIPRGLDANILKEKADEFSLNGQTYVSVETALSAAKKAASANDLIYVGGSTFVVAEVIN